MTGTFLCTAEQAAEILQVSTATLAKWRVAGGGPAFIKVGRRVRYMREDIDKWLATRKFENTSQIRA